MIKKKKTKKLKCDNTYCLYNSSCCGMPYEKRVKISECYCKKSNDIYAVGLNSDKTCDSFIFDTEKPGECVECQIQQYGYVSAPLLHIDRYQKKIEMEIDDIEDEY